MNQSDLTYSSRCLCRHREGGFFDIVAFVESDMGGYDHQNLTFSGSNIYLRKFYVLSSAVDFPENGRSMAF